MAREWQQTKLKEYIMPDAVYYQSIWAVRDLERMENRLRELEETEALKGKPIVSDGRKGYSETKPTEKTAMEKLILEERIKGIHRALSVVPEEFRSFVLSNIILKNSGTSFPDKIWRIWKQRFLFNVAKNLSIM